MEIDKKLFRKYFPNLADEIDKGLSSLPIESVRTDEKVGEERGTLSGFMPDVIDFLRRCDTEDQALEILAYMEKRKEITHEYAERLTIQLKEKGVRSFGEKKEHGYYLRKYYYRDR
jgi:hypothetical protein